MLYTWLLLCFYCCEEIVEKLEGVRAECIVVYTSTMRHVTVEEERKIVTILESSGITIRKELYDKKLQRMGYWPW